MAVEKEKSDKLKNAIRDIQDYPKEGIIFKDITTLLKKPELLKLAIDEFADHFRGKGIKYVVGIESRGFIFGAALAIALGVGFIPVRKKGKLPAETTAVDYSLEYGTDTLEIHTDAIEKGSKVLISDDLLATGGTAEAVIELLERVGGEIVGLCFLIELTILNGVDHFSDYEVVSLIQY